MTKQKLTLKLLLGGLLMACLIAFSFANVVMADETESSSEEVVTETSEEVTSEEETTEEVTTEEVIEETAEEPTEEATTAEEPTVSLLEEESSDSSTVGNFNYTVSGSNATVTGYTGTEKEITIPENVTIGGTSYKVTTIGANAFEGNTAITKVTLPDSITSIGDSAFSGCTSLTTIARSGKSEKYVLIGDSYGRGFMNGSDDPSRSWITYAMSQLGTSNYYWAARGQVGIAAGIPQYSGDSDRSFSELLYETGAPRYDVTQVVIMGGYNDFWLDGGLLELYIQRLCENARAYYPNAEISIGMCGCGSSWTLSYVNKTAEIYKECTRYGCSYIYGIENIIANNISGYLTNDGIHPNVQGQQAIGSAVAAYLSNVVDLPSGLTSIGSNAFAGCSSVSRVVYNSSPSVGDNAFAGCSIPSYSPAVRSAVNGWYKIGNTGLCYYDNDAVASYLTDFMEYNGKSIYVQNGYKAINFSGLASDKSGAVIYISNGEVDLTANGVEPYNGGWWYVKNGKIDFSYTGIAENENGWWRIVNGAVDFGCNSVVYTEYGWVYILGGEVQYDYTGIAPNEYGWWRIVNGVVDFNCNTVEANEYGWWYCQGGKVQFDYTGIAPNQYGWWRIVNGCVDFGCNSVEANEYGWFYLRGGKVDFNYTGIAQNGYGWWYISNGAVNFGYNGTVNYFGTNYRVENGKVIV